MAKKYKVSVEAALKKFTASEQFRQHLRSGQYLYVEKRVCINHPKYVQWIDAEASLTDYAREHQDECCLHLGIFPKKTSDQRVNHRVTGIRGGSHLVLHQRQSCRKFRYYKSCPPISQMPIQRLTKGSRAVIVLAESLPNNFTQMLDKLIESKNMTEEDLAESSSLSEKTIQRLRNHEPKSVTLETVLQLCIGLHLHPILSEYLLRAAGQHFMDTRLHTMYKFLLYTCYDYSVETCNDLLESQGFPVLGKTKKFLPSQDTP